MLQGETRVLNRKVIKANHAGNCYWSPVFFSTWAALRWEKQGLKHGGTPHLCSTGMTPGAVGQSLQGTVLGLAPGAAGSAEWGTIEVVNSPTLNCRDRTPTFPGETAVWMQLLLSRMAQIGGTSSAWCITPACSSKELNSSSFAVANFPLWIAGKRKGERNVCLQLVLPHLVFAMYCPKYSFQNAICAVHVHRQWVFLSITCGVPCLTYTASPVIQRQIRINQILFFLNSTVALVGIALRKNGSECTARFKPAVREISGIILRYDFCQIRKSEQEELWNGKQGKWLLRHTSAPLKHSVVAPPTMLCISRFQYPCPVKCNTNLRLEKKQCVKLIQAPTGPWMEQTQQSTLSDFFGLFSPSTCTNSVWPKPEEILAAKNICPVLCSGEKVRHPASGCRRDAPRHAMLGPGPCLSIAGAANGTWNGFASGDGHNSIWRQFGGTQLVIYLHNKVCDTTHPNMYEKYINTP